MFKIVYRLLYHHLPGMSWILAKSHLDLSWDITTISAYSWTRFFIAWIVSMSLSPNAIGSEAWLTYVSSCQRQTNNIRSRCKSEQGTCTLYSIFLSVVGVFYTSLSIETGVYDTLWFYFTGNRQGHIFAHKITRIGIRTWDLQQNW